MARGIAIGVLVVAAAAIATLVFSPPVPHAQRVASSSPSAPAGASPSPSPPLLRDYGPPPAGVPLVYAASPSDPRWITAFDWQGQPRGTIKLAAPLSHELVVEPHCYVLEDPQTFDEVLYTVVDGQAPKRIAVIANEGSLGQTGIEAIECNFAADRAIAARTTVGRPSDVWLLRISDGSRLAHWSYAPAGIAGVVASSDGRYLAETTDLAVRVRNTGTGAIEASMQGQFPVSGFSADDNLLVEGPGGDTGPARVVEWRTGRVVWTSKGDAWPDPIQVAPGGGDVLIALASRQQEFSLTQDYSKPLVIVHADGTEAAIPGRYLPIFPPYADGNYPYKGGTP